jgi:effector-binding domain-containing protein
MIKPELKERSVVSYAGLRLRISREDLAQAVPEAISKLGSYFDRHNLLPSGPALVRYLVVDYNSDDVEVDVGFPHQLPAIPADEKIHYGQLPQGTYAAVLHEGPYDSLVDTTKALLEWAKDTDHPWRVLSENNVTWWAARVEHYLVAPPREPSPSQWRTEVAILLRAPG